MKNLIGVRIVLLALAFGALLTTGGCVDSPSKNQRDPLAVTYRKPTRKECPSVDGLKQFVFREKQNNHVNHFIALVPHREGEPDQSLWLYWEEDHRIIFHSASRFGTPTEEGFQIAIAKSLDLMRDVVEREEDVHGSTYLVTRAWADEVLSQCEHRGVKLFVPAFDKLETDDN
jgi:hypothetical protein